LIESIGQKDDFLFEKITEIVGSIASVDFTFFVSTLPSIFAVLLLSALGKNFYDSKNYF
jgi:putative Mn2+ efflux pump MntP